MKFFIDSLGRFKDKKEIKYGLGWWKTHDLNNVQNFQTKNVIQGMFLNKFHCKCLKHDPQDLWEEI
jgi:hypothetical protein